MTDEPDGGLQPERTRLAWRRTILAMTVELLLATTRVVTGRPWPGLAGVVVIAGALVAALVVAHGRNRALTTQPHPAQAATAPAMLSLLTVALAAGGALVVL